LSTFCALTKAALSSRIDDRRLLRTVKLNAYNPEVLHRPAQYCVDQSESSNIFVEHITFATCKEKLTVSEDYSGTQKAYCWQAYLPAPQIWSSFNYCTDVDIQIAQQYPS
jgi:hypothetical protein